MRRSLAVAAALGWTAFSLALAPARAEAGAIGIPCAQGSFSASGFEPCTPCPAGTYAPVEGMVQCTACQPGTWAPQGATYYQLCACADEPLCTLDLCNATTGDCTTHDPAPACEPYRVRVFGTVTDQSGDGPPLASLGEPIQGSWLVDPSEFDRSVVEWAGTYPYAIRDLRIRAGLGLAAREASGDLQSLYVEPVPERDSDYLDLVANLDAPGYEGGGFTLTLEDGDDPAITSDAIPPAFPSTASFARRELVFRLYAGEESSTVYSDDYVLVTPEPESTLAAAVGAAALAAVRRAARRRGAAR